MKKLVRSAWLRPRPERGQAVIEMAMTLPVVVAIILLVLELGFAFNAYTTVSAAARSGARAGAVYLYIRNADPDPVNNKALNKTNRESGTGISPGYQDNVRDSVARRLATIRTGSSYFDKNADITINYTPAAPQVDSGAGDIINVHVTYHYRPLTGFFGNYTFDLQGHASERME